MSTTYIFQQCAKGSHPAEGWLCAPDGRHIFAMCAFHAQKVIEEYTAVLKQAWTFED